MIEIKEDGSATLTFQYNTSRMVVRDLSQGQHLLLMGRKYPGGLDIVAGLALRNREGEITQITGLCIDPKAGESLGDALRRILPPGYELIWLPEDHK